MSIIAMIAPMRTRKMKNGNSVCIPIWAGKIGLSTVPLINVKLDALTIRTWTSTTIWSIQKKIWFSTTGSVHGSMEADWKPKLVRCPRFVFLLPGSDTPLVSGWTAPLRPAWQRGSCFNLYYQLYNICRKRIIASTLPIKSRFRGFA